MEVLQVVYLATGASFVRREVNAANIMCEVCVGGRNAMRAGVPCACRRSLP
jgi:hypothetical protein